MLSACTTISDYLNTYGQLIGTQAQASLNPLHVPSRDEPLCFSDLKRPPFPAQAHAITACVKQLHRDRACYLIGEQGVGKAQPLSCGILTPSGWTTMGQLSVGQEIVDPEGGTSKVLAIHKRGVLPTFEVKFKDGSSTRCCGDHLWAVNTHIRISRRNPPLIRKTSEIAASIKMDWGVYRHWVRNTVPVEFNDTLRSDDIDPYVMGVLLGDGGLTGGYLNAGSVNLTSADPELVNEVRELIRSDTIEVKPTGSLYGYRISGSRSDLRNEDGTSAKNSVVECLRRHDLMGKRSFEKHIPESYLFSSIKNRISLLQGLCDTDGHVDARSSGHGIDYVTTSSQLAEDIRELVLSLGGSTEIKTKNTSYDYKGEHLTGRTAYRLYIKLPDNIIPVRLSRKVADYHRHDRRPMHRPIISVTPVGSEECWCITVSSKSSTYITDDYIVTHNSLLAVAIAHNLARSPTTGLVAPYRALIMCPPHLTHKWEREIRNTIHGSEVIQLRHVRQLMAMRNHPKHSEPNRMTPPDSFEWWIVKENAAKSGASWRPAFNQHASGAVTCPQCGQIVADKKGVPISADSDALMLNHTYNVGEGDATPSKCDSPLWSFCRTDSGRANWAIARYARTHLPKFWDILICDEIQEERGRDSARATALSQLASAAKHCLGMTGTFAGGYAHQIRTLLMRLSPRSLCRQGLDWKQETAFNELYGRIETKVISTSSPGSDNKTSQGKSKRSTKSVKPGIMPTLFGEHMIDKTLFLSLDEMVSNLPTLHEQVITCDLDPDVAKEYKRIETLLRAAITAMLQKGDKRLLGSMLRVLLTYPDHPYGFDTIGYTDNGFNSEGVPTSTFVPVVSPKDLNPHRKNKDTGLLEPRAKEQALLSYVRAQHALGRQVWIYVNDTNKYDIQVHLQSLMESIGLRARILRSNTVPTEDREEWIEEYGHDVDVMISHPQLVQTGLDLFSPRGTHNFCSIVFYQTGYDLFILRQASRRAWRIGQRKNCEVVYFYYLNTMQARAMSLMGKKLSTANAIEGKFSDGGLAAMGEDDDSIEVELARSLSERFDDSVTSRSWTRITGNSSLVTPTAAVDSVNTNPVPLTRRPLFKKG
jgi:hypothetical protein